MRRRDFLHLSGMPLLVSALSASRARVQSAAPGPVVETAAGRLRGLAREGVVTFKGIRYGASTAGVNRFQPPVRPQPWTGIVDAFEYGPRAWQPFRAMIPEIGDALTGSGPMDEDCLRVNVWTPAIDRGRRPVMVWFHGGGQRTGSGNSIFYDGTELARKHDVVVVRVTHRLNALGYLWLAGLPGISERFSRTANLPLADLGARARVGARQHRAVRRQSGKRHDLRAVGRRRQSRDAHRLPCREGTLPSRDHHEHARRHRCHGPRAGARGRGRRAVARASRRDSLRRRDGCSRCRPSRWLRR